MAWLCTRRLHKQWETTGGEQMFESAKLSLYKMSTRLAVVVIAKITMWGFRKMFLIKMVKFHTPLRTLKRASWKIDQPQRKLLA